MRITVLGATTITAPDGTPIPIPHGKLRQLLTVLAVADHPIRSADLQETLWGPDGDRKSALTTTVTKLRRLLPGDLLVHDDDGYQMRLAPDDSLDVDEFTYLTHRAATMRDTLPGQAADLYARALRLWVPKRLPELPDTPLARSLAYRLLITRRDAVEGFAEVRLALGYHATVARELAPYLAEDPTNAHLVAPLMIAAYRDGRKADALRIYERARAEMLSATGAEPGPVLKDLRARIAADDPRLLWLPDLPAHEARAIAAGVDPSRMYTSRMYDYLLGGRDNFAVDREAAELLRAAVPEVGEMAVANRACLIRMARFLAAECGIRQFVDLGSGLPTSPNVHEVVRGIHPAGRVVYADIDPLVCALIRASRIGPDVACVEADAGEPGQIIGHPDVRALIDPTRPVGLLAISVLHYVPNADQVVEAFKEWMPPGSCLAVSASSDVGLTVEGRARVQATFAGSTATHHIRTRAEIEAWFDGLELVDPGVVEAALWRNPEGPRFAFTSLAGVGRKL